MKVEQRITELVEEKIIGTDLFLVNIRMTPNNIIMILIDGDHGISIQQCVEISRHVGFTLEEENAIDHAYTLEVSSPGAEAPLLLKRQYAKNKGRRLSVKLNDQSKKEGKLIEVEEHQITIEETIKEKGKKAVEITTTVPFSDINEAKVLISFK